MSVPTGWSATSTPPRRPSDGYGQAERIDFEGENQIRLTNATYSTCKPGETDSYARADEMRLDYDRETRRGDQRGSLFQGRADLLHPGGVVFPQPPAQIRGSFRGLSRPRPKRPRPERPLLEHRPNYDATLYPAT